MRCFALTRLLFLCMFTTIMHHAFAADQAFAANNTPFIEVHANPIQCSVGDEIVLTITYQWPTHHTN